MIPYRRLLLKSNFEERDNMSLAHSNTDYRAVVNRLAEKYKPYHEGIKPWHDESKDEKTDSEELEYDCNLKIPPWICQPYYRLPPEEHKQLIEEKARLAETREKKQYFDKDGNTISRKHMKKLKRLERRAKVRSERNAEICGEEKCANTKGLKCEYNLCRHCCRKICFEKLTNCHGHKIFSTKYSKKESIEKQEIGKIENEIMEAE